MALSNPGLWTMRFPATGTVEDAMGGYEAAQAERDRHFKKVQPAGNWKMPIDAVINAEDFDDCNQAAIWFTGAGLTIEGYLPADKLRVTGPGYYATIGS